MTAAVVPGAWVWAVLGGVLCFWFVLTSVVPALPGPRQVAHWLLSSWAPRLTLIVIWGAAGWHVFCQRP